jgi:general secretion pathway protein G
MNYVRRENGFILIEVLAVVIIVAVLAAIAIPKLVSSTVNARRQADVATAHELKAALDRYQLDYGVYPKTAELTVVNGAVVSANLIPKYINKLDKSTTQQLVPDANKGFGLGALVVNPTDPTQFSIPNSATVANPIMIYLSGNGLAAEVRAYDEGLDDVLWSSAN